MSGFAGKLKQQREAAGLTQAQLGERAGVHKLTIAKLEQGIREPGWETVQAIARSLSLDCRAFADDGQEAKEPELRRGRPPRNETASEKPKKKKRPSRRKKFADEVRAKIAENEAKRK